MYGLLRRYVRLTLRAFFREVDVVGREQVPEQGGGLYVAWHPNALIDPALILSSSPRAVIFGARHGLFRVPILGRVLRGLGTVPIHRACDDASDDPTARRTANERSLDALAGRIGAGAFSALFPEGDSHDLPHLADLKTGAARLYYRARQLTPPGQLPPSIVPVGLHYDSKRVFRSGAVVWFHPPIELPPELDVTPDPEEPPEETRRRARALTDRIGVALTSAALATDDWLTYRAMHRIRKLMRVEEARRGGTDPGRTSPGEKVRGFARVRKAYARVRQQRPETVDRLMGRVVAYDDDLRALGLEDHELDRPPRVGYFRLAAWLLLQAAFVYLFLPPLLVVGLIVNGPAALLVTLVANRHAGRRKDVASLKILLGSLVFPLAWISAGLLAVWTHGYLRTLYPSLPAHAWWTGVAVSATAILGWMASVRYVHLARRTAHALNVRLTRARRRYSTARLIVERRRLYDELTALGEPGASGPPVATG